MQRYYVYILKSAVDGQMYVGCTHNLQERFALHNSKKVASTKRRAPFCLIYYEAFPNKTDAFAREQFFKTGWGKNHLKKLLGNFFNSLKV